MAANGKSNLHVLQRNACARRRRETTSIGRQWRVVTDPLHAACFIWQKCAKALPPTRDFTRWRRNERRESRNARCTRKRIEMKSMASPVDKCRTYREICWSFHVKSKPTMLGGQVSGFFPDWASSIDKREFYQSIQSGVTLYRTCVVWVVYLASITPARQSVIWYLTAKKKKINKGK